MRERTDSLPLEVPVFPLPNAILYPGVVLPLYIFEERYKLMIDRALDSNRMLAISYLKKGARGTLHPSMVCGLGEIIRVEELGNGEKNIMLKGISRVALREVKQQIPYLQATFQPLDEIRQDGPETENSRREIALLAQQLVFVLDLKDANRWMNLLGVMEDPGFLADFVAFYFLKDDALKQDLLETLDIRIRLNRVRVVLEKTIGKMESR